MIELPSDAQLWGNTFSPRRLPIEIRPTLGRRAALALDWAAERGCQLWVSRDLGWAERLADQTKAHRVWAPLRAQYWPNHHHSTAVMIMSRLDSDRAVASICVRRLWVEGTLTEALATAFGTNAPGETIEFDGDLGRGVSDVDIAWACGLWRDDALRGAHVGAALVETAAIDALARWRWSWLMGLRRPVAQDRLGLPPFRRLEQPVGGATSDLMLVAASRTQVRTRGIVA